MTQPLGWDFFDKSYCITLESRPDRMLAAQRQFAAVGLDERVEFLIVAKDSENPERGIFHSHLRCLSQGLAAGARHILVFEDDVFFRGFSPERLSAACHFLQQTGKWDAFFLGCLTTGSRPTDRANVVQVKYRCLAHAYALNRACAERIVREQWQGIPFDGLLHRCGPHFFALQPMCAFQGLASSDNETVLIDKLRKLCGGLPFIQRCNELFQNNKGLVIALHLLVAALAIVSFTLARQ
ncbi:MAG: glycosyltransferase [Desulfobulbaceae bacterium]|nr:glycosyltransferase [Desulfobulbaceae bacterium]